MRNHNPHINKYGGLLQINKELGAQTAYKETRETQTSITLFSDRTKQIYPRLMIKAAREHIHVQ